jgi:hypothetical protein
MKTKIKIAAGLLLAGALAHADVLKLKQGAGVQGLLVSANSSEVVFMGTDGVQKSYAVSTVSGVDFAPLPPPPVPAIPTGTQITVRMVDAIDGKTAKGGAVYRATIDDPIGLGTQTVFPRGANCIVEVVSLDEGKNIGLRLKEINVGGKVYALSTEYAHVEAKGASKKKKALRRGVGLGAVGAGIGAMAGGGSGAAIGAVVGGAVGAASAAGADGKQINVPTEARLIFALKTPVPLN